MGNKTLYVSDEDEQVWEEAGRLGDVSVSKLATEGLRAMLAERRETDAEREQGGRDPEVLAAAARFARDVRRLGIARAGEAFALACVRFGVETSRAGRKAAETKGPAGRKAAGEKAAATRKARATGGRP